MTIHSSKNGRPQGLHKKNDGKMTKIGLISGTVLIIASFGALVFAHLQRPELLSTTVNTNAISQLNAAVNSNAVVSNARTINSKLGFSATYDTSIINARAQITNPLSTDTYIYGEEFKDDELVESRDYSMLIFEAKSADSTTPTSFEIHPRLRISTNIRNTYFTSRQSLPEYAGKSEIDVLEMVMTKSRLENDTAVTPSKAVEINLGGVNYRKITYSTSRASLIGGDPYVSTEDLYFTVQNGRPYWASITFIKDSNRDLVRLLEPIIASVSFSDSSSTAGGKNTYQTASSAVIEIPKGASYIPKKIDDNTIVSVVIKNQPAVVRIGTIFCSNATLKDSSSTTILSIPKTCTGGVGSGTFVSKDGYIATNGHVVAISPTTIVSSYAEIILLGALKTGDTNELKQYLEYYEKTNVIVPGKLDTFISFLVKRDEQAISTYLDLYKDIPKSQITFTNESTQYVIQTSNDPIRFADFDEDKGTYSKFAFNKTNIEAKYIDSNFDKDLDLSKGYGSLSDVAILKAEGGDYPVVTIGQIDSIKTASQLTAIGFPAFVDGAIATTQTKTVPSVTQGFVKEIARASDTTNYKVISTTVPIAPGNSGGPAFNDNGEQIGLNTYGLASCDDRKCFGDGTARDIADFKELIKKNNITLLTDSLVTKEWNEALSDFSNGNYTQAKEKLENVMAMYPANYMASSLIDIASSRIGGADDTSQKFASNNLLTVIAAVGILIGLTIGTVAFVYIRLRKRNQSKSFEANTITPAVPTQPNPPTFPTQQITPQAPQPPQPFSPATIPTQPVQPIPISSTPVQTPPINLAPPQPPQPPQQPTQPTQPGQIPPTAG